mgnify:CR=1 FL=1
MDLFRECALKETKILQLLSALGCMIFAYVDVQRLHYPSLSFHLAELMLMFV